MALKKEDSRYKQGETMSQDEGAYKEAFKIWADANLAWDALRGKWVNDDIAFAAWHARNPEIDALKAENAYHYAALIELIKAGQNVMSEFQKTDPEIAGSLYVALQELNKKLYVEKFDKVKP